MTITKLPEPSTLPTGMGNTAVYSNNGNFLVVCHNTTPFITIYSRSGTTFTKLSDSATLPAGSGADAAWSSDDSLLAVSHFTTPFVTIYSVSGTTFTKLSDPVSLPGQSGRGAAFRCAPLRGTTPLAVQFTDESIASPGGVVNTWLWDFGDSTTSTDQYSIHEYTVWGKYTVKLTVKNQYGSDTLERTNYIKVRECLCG